MTTRQITIQGLTFEASQPYVEGHTVTAAEAAALNQVRAENLRNNFAAKIKAVKGDAETLTEEQMTALASDFAEYDAGYEFTLASAGGGKRETDPVQAEARKIAKAAIAADLQAKGRTLKSVDADKLAEAIAKVAASEKVQKLARKTIEARQAAAASALDDLDLG